MLACLAWEGKPRRKGEFVWEGVNGDSAGRGKKTALMSEEEYSAKAGYEYEFKNFVCKI